MIDWYSHKQHINESALLYSIKLDFFKKTASMILSADGP